MYPVTFARFRSLLLLLCFSLGGLCAQAASPLRPDKLTCEYLVNPLGIDAAAPRLSWTLASTRRNEVQAAYELIVGDQLRAVEQEQGALWATGKVSGNANLHIRYAGKPLQPFTRYYWRVRVYDRYGVPSGWSAPAWFETAMLRESDWKGVWIGDGRPPFEHDEAFYGDDPMPLLRKGFAPSKKLAAARLYISGLGYHEAYLNGEKIGDHVLDPGWTTYAKQVFYVTHDVTSLVRRGANTLGVILGNGWYNPLPMALFGRFNLRKVQQTGRPCLRAQLLLRYTDGSSEWVATDSSWQHAPGPVVRNNVYLGEHYDARRELPDWTAAGAWWKPVSMVSGPSGVLTPQLQPPVRVTRTLQPASITEVGKDTFIVDMGQNFAGVARIRVKGPAGRRVVLRYGEGIHPDGRLNFLTTTAGHIKEMWNLKGGPGAPKTAWQEDSYTLRGGGVEQWAPRFTFHGFRYVEITGWPGRPTAADIEGLRMNADLPQAGSFACSNDMFNRLQEVIGWTFLSNVFSVQSDCPGREKMGYGADIVVTSEAFMYNFDMAQFYSKAVRDFANDQQPDGGITEIAPYTGIADRGYGGESGPLGWQLVFPFLQKKLYEFYGDKQLIEQYYPAVRKQMAFLKGKAVGGLFHWDISDHESLDPKPEAFTAAAFYYHHALLAAEFATLLGHGGDAQEYSRLAGQIKNAVIRKYEVPGTGRFDNATQAAQLFALWYGFAADSARAMQVLDTELARHQQHLSTGIFGTKMLFDVLRTANRNDVAYGVANQRTFPGWGHMLAKGATTLWESWQQPDNATSMNHPMFGSISEWFYRSLLGINAGAPGFRHIIIKPQPAGDLKWAKGSYASVQGKVETAWHKDRDGFRMQATVPANTTAEIWLPAGPNDVLTEGGQPLGAVQLKVNRYEAGYAVINVGSGTYTFASTGG